MLDPAGTPVKEGAALDIKEKNGYMILTKKGDPVAQSAVLTADGKTVIPYGPALVEPLNEQFWLATFAVKETKNKDEANYPVLINSTGKDILEIKKKGYFDLPSLRPDLDPEDGQGLLTFTNTETDNIHHSLMNTDGKEICKEIYTSICYEGAGYYYGNRKEGADYVYDVFDSQGTLMGEKLENFGTIDMIAYKENKASGSRKYYIYDKKDYTLEQKGAQSIGFGLLKVSDEKSDKYGLYDVFSGNQILKSEYANIYYAYNNIYAYKDGVYTIYNVKR